ncbi:MAG: hypothetical protein M3452_07670 [Chloroflexota bacterium]|nr:hypothetical protein [Chloroflexota bacterium]
MTHHQHLTRMRQQELMQEIQQRVWRAQAGREPRRARARVLRVLRLQRR